MRETPDQTINRLQDQVIALKQQLKEAQAAKFVAELDADFVVLVEESSLIAPRDEKASKLLRELEEAKTRAYARMYARMARSDATVKAQRETK